MTQPHAHAALVEKVAQLLMKQYSATRHFPNLDAHKIIALIAEETKEATNDMALDGFGQLDMEASPHAAEDCWSAMHHASALWPKEPQ